MLKLVNFAHPLLDSIKDQIERKVQGPIEVIYHPAQFDLTRSLASQIDDLVAGIIEDADLVIPPSLSAAAVLLSDHFLPDKRPGIVWLKRADETMPPKWILGGIE